MIWIFVALVSAAQPELHVQVGHASDLSGVVFSTLEKRVVSFSADNKSIVWEVASGQPVFDIDLPSKARAVWLDDKTQTLRVVAASGEVWVIDLEAGAVRTKSKLAMEAVWGRARFRHPRARSIACSCR